MYEHPQNNQINNSGAQPESAYYTPKATATPHEQYQNELQEAIDRGGAPQPVVPEQNPPGTAHPNPYYGASAPYSVPEAQTLEFALSVPLLSKLKRNPRYCFRSEIHRRRLDNLKKLLKGGNVLEPLVVWRDGRNLYLIDGFHRLALALECNIARWPAVVLSGPLYLALEWAIKCNTSKEYPLGGADGWRAALVLSMAKGRPIDKIEMDSVRIESRILDEGEVEHCGKHLAHPSGLNLFYAPAIKENRKKGKKL